MLEKRCDKMPRHKYEKDVKSCDKMLEISITKLLLVHISKFQRKKKKDGAKKVVKTRFEKKVGRKLRKRKLEESCNNKI